MKEKRKEEKEDGKRKEKRKKELKLSSLVLEENFPKALTAAGTLPKAFSIECYV